MKRVATISRNTARVNHNLYQMRAVVVNEKHIGIVWCSCHMSTFEFFSRNNDARIQGNGLAPNEITLDAFRDCRLIGFHHPRCPPADSNY